MDPNHERHDGEAERIVVVGASVAGVAAAARLAAAGREVVLLEAEDSAAVPYDRPPLTGELLDPATADPAGLLGALGTDLGLAEGVDLRTGHRVLAAAATEDGVRVRIETPHGPAEMDAAVLVAATGRAPRQRPGWRSFATGDDALALRSDLAAGRPVTLLGGGWTGAELASAARGWDVPTRLLVRTPPVLRPMLGELAGRVQGWLEDLGVEVVTVDGDAEGAALPGSVRIAVIGSEPVGGWLSGLGAVPGDAGLRTDGALRALDAHGAPVAAGRVVITGDLAAPDGVAPDTRGHWNWALASGQAAAATVLADVGRRADGSDAGSRAAAGRAGSDGSAADGAAAVAAWRGWAYSTIAGRDLAVLGDVGVLGTGAGTRVERPGTKGGSVVLTLGENGILTGGVTLAAPRDTSAVRKALAGAPVRPDPAVLRDPEVPLKQALREAPGAEWA